MIDIQRQVKDIMKIVIEANTIITEMEDIILKASINNQIINATNITRVSEDLSVMEHWTLTIFIFFRKTMKQAHDKEVT